MTIDLKQINDFAIEKGVSVVLTLPSIVVGSNCLDLDVRMLPLRYKTLVSFEELANLGDDVTEPIIDLIGYSANKIKAHGWRDEEDEEE